MKLTPRENIAIQIFMDIFTKFAWIFTVKEHTAEESADNILSILSMWGVPKEVQSDQGTEYITM